MSSMLFPVTWAVATALLLIVRARTPSGHATVAELAPWLVALALTVALITLIDCAKTVVDSRLHLAVEAILFALVFLLLARSTRTAT